MVPLFQCFVNSTTRFAATSTVCGRGVLSRGRNYGWLVPPLSMGPTHLQ